MDISRFSDEIPALEVRNLRKRFGRQIALDGVHFELQQGERLGLLGPNGAGKTTLVRCLARRIRADEGEIQILGAPLAPGGTLSVLGVVPQELAIYEDLTAKQNLKFFGKILCSQKDYWVAQGTLNVQEQMPINPIQELRGKGVNETVFLVTHDLM